MSDRVEQFRQLLEKFPDNEMARFSLGKAYYDLNQFAAAKDQLELALLKRPDWMVVQILVGKCELSLGNKHLAVKAFERARQLAIDQKHEGPQAEMDELLQELAE